MTTEELLACLPFARPYLFIDEINEVSEDQLIGGYTFQSDEFFYEGHFPGRPITPGAILGESASQAVLALGIFLLRAEENLHNRHFFLTSSDLKFKNVVLPGERVSISVDKIHFRFNQLKCRVKMTKLQGQLVCRGVIAGILLNTDEYGQ